MAVQFKQKCDLCKANYVTVSSWRRRGPIVCFECEKKSMEGEIADPEMKKLFDIPQEFYRQSPFLRSIKINYLRYKSLSPAQLEAFKKTVKDIESRKSAE
jgi:hypothetical protein